MDQVTVEMKGVRERNRDELPTFESIDGTYVWIGDSSGCFVAITDLRTLRKMKAVLDEVVECRSRRSQRQRHE